MAHVITLANHKGGAAKTTSVANLGAALAMAPFYQRVLLIDADPQANLSTQFGINDDMNGYRLEDLLEPPSWSTAPPVWSHLPDAPDPRPLAGGVHLIPCSDALSDVVTEQQHAEGFSFRLRALVGLYRDEFDYILIDTPPGAQALASLALLGTDWVIAPARPADFDIEAAIRLTEMLEDDISRFNPNIKMLGVLLNQTDRRWKIAASARRALEEANIILLPREIPVAVRVQHAPRFCAPTIVLEPDGRVGCAYRDVARLITTALSRAELPNVAAAA